MATISDKLTQINNIKQGIKEAIIAGGGTVGDDFSKYPEAVSKFSIDYKNPDFYDLRTQNGTNFDNLFRGYNGPDIDVSAWDTSKVTSAQYCFAECKKSMDISNWDLSSLKNAYYMFSSFTNNSKYLDLSVLDFSNVTNAQYMFQGSNTDYLDVRNINLTGTTNYSNLFSNNNGTELDLSAWDISNVTSLNFTFSSADFKKINLTGWNTANVKDFSYTFYNYSSPLTKLIIPDWDMTNATYTSSFMSGCDFLKYVDLSRSNDLTIKKIASMLPTKTKAAYGEILVQANTSQDAIDALIAKYWKPIGPKLDLTSTELALDIYEIKPGKTTKVWTCNNDPWYGDDRPETIEFISSNESVATINGIEITGVAEGTTEIICRRRDTQEVISISPITLTVSETDSNPNLIKFRMDSSGNTASSSSKILIINGVTIYKNKLIYDSLRKTYSYDPGKQITSIRFNYDSSYAYVNELIKFNFNAANITNTERMFYCYKGTTLDLSDWDTSNVTFAECMFSYCSNLIDIIGELDLSNLETGFNSGGTARYLIQTDCRNLETLYLKNIYKNCTMTNNSKWGIYLGDTKVKDECLIYIINELPNLYDKGLTDTDQIKLTLPPTNKLTAEQVKVAKDKGWTVVNCNFS